MVCNLTWVLNHVEGWGPESSVLIWDALAVVEGLVGVVVGVV